MKQSKFLGKSHLRQDKEYRQHLKTFLRCLLPVLYQYPDFYGNTYFFLLMFLYKLSITEHCCFTKYIKFMYNLLNIKDRFLMTSYEKLNQRVQYVLLSLWLLLHIMLI